MFNSKKKGVIRVIEVLSEKLSEYTLSLKASPRGAVKKEISRR